MDINELQVRLLHAAKTQDQWKAVTSYPKKGEVCLEAINTTGATSFKIKIGDGTRPYCRNTGTTEAPVWDFTSDQVLPYFGSVIETSGTVNVVAISTYNTTKKKLSFYTLGLSSTTVGGSTTITPTISQTPYLEMIEGDGIEFTTDETGTIKELYINIASTTEGTATTIVDGGTFTAVTVDSNNKATKRTTFTLPSISDAIKDLDSTSTTVSTTSSTDVITTVSETDGIVSSTKKTIVEGNKIDVTAPTTGTSIGNIIISHEDIDTTATDVSSTITTDSSSVIDEKELDVITGLKVDAQGHITHIDKDKSTNLVAADIKGSVSITDDSAWIYRPTGGTISIGEDIAKVKGLEGNSCVWNQLNALEPKTISNADFTTVCHINAKTSHHYLIRGILSRASQNSSTDFQIYISGTAVPTQYRVDDNKTLFYSRQIANQDGIIQAICASYSGFVSNVTVTIVAFDLTLLGIDNLTTTDQVESWLAQHVGIKPYYDYNAGEILSAKTLGFNTYGQNLLNPTTKQARLVTYTDTTNSNKYTIKNIPDGATITYTPYNTGIAVDVTSLIINNTFDITSYGDGIIGFSAVNDDTYVCIKWDGSKDDDIVPHEEHNYNFDVTKVYGRVSGAGEYVQCFPNGMRSAGSVRDEVTATKAIKRVRVVDMKDISWSYHALYIFKADIADKANAVSANSKDNILCVKYPTQTGNNVIQGYTGNSIGGSIANGRVFVYDSSYKTNEDLVNFVKALSGVMLNYELATPITYTDLIYSEDGGQTGTPLKKVLLTMNVSDFGTEEQVLPDYVDDNPTSVPANVVIEYKSNFKEAVLETIDKVNGYKNPVRSTNDTAQTTGKVAVYDSDSTVKSSTFEISNTTIDPEGTSNTTTVPTVDAVVDYVDDVVSTEVTVKNITTKDVDTTGNYGIRVTNSGTTYDVHHADINQSDTTYSTTANELVANVVTNVTVDDFGHVKGKEVISSDKLIAADIKAPVTVTDDSMWSYRTTAKDVTIVGEDSAHIDTLKGKTLKWNQLLKQGKLVDMGLPSGLLWATCNIDITQEDGFATSPFQYGCTMFSWGNIEGHNTPASGTTFDYNWGGVNAQAPWYEGQPYGETPGAALSANIVAGDTQDAARYNLGSLFKMPSSTQLQELINNCDFVQADGTTVIDSSVTDKRVTVNGVVGIYLKSKVNGNLIFFSASGYGDGLVWGAQGVNGVYWSSSFDSERYAQRLYFSSGGVNPQYNGYRYIGFAVRAVVNPNTVDTGHNNHKYFVTKDMNVDLTEMGLDSITSPEKFKALYPLDYYDYTSTPVLINNAASGIKTTGFNQWDEEWEVGTIDASTGQNYNDTTTIRSKNYIRVFPSTNYYIRSVNNKYISLAFYTINKEFISFVWNKRNEIISIPSNCYYIRLTPYYNYGTTYKNDICINLSWSGYRNGEYEPYEEHTLYFNGESGSLATITGKKLVNGEPTGESVTIFPDGMKSAGSVYDFGKADSDGYIRKVTKRIGSVDLGSLTWEYNYTMRANLPFAYTEDSISLISNYYTQVFGTWSELNGNNKCYAICTSPQIRILDTSYANATTFKTAMSGVYLYYELATPEEYLLDTPIPANYIVNDFGTEERIPDGVDSTTGIPLSTPFTGIIQYKSNFKDSVIQLIEKVNNYKNPVQGANNTLQTVGKLAVYDTNHTVASSIYSASNATIVEGATGNNVILPSVETLVTYVNSKLSSALTYKGTVDEWSDLPTSGQNIGDMYIASASFTHDGTTYNAGDFFIWNGTSWDIVSGTTSVINGDVTLAMDGTEYTLGTIDGIDITVTTPNLEFSDPTANGNSLSYIDTISQDNGVISATKKTIPDASTSQKGVVELSSGIETATSGSNDVTTDYETLTNLNLRDVGVGSLTSDEETNPTYTGTLHKRYNNGSNWVSQDFYPETKYDAIIDFSTGFSINYPDLAKIENATTDGDSSTTPVTLPNTGFLKRTYNSTTGVIGWELTNDTGKMTWLKAITSGTDYSYTPLSDSSSNDTEVGSYIHNYPGVTSIDLATLNNTNKGFRINVPILTSTSATSGKVLKGITSSLPTWGRVSLEELDEVNTITTSSASGTVKEGLLRRTKTSTNLDEYEWSFDNTDIVSSVTTVYNNGNEVSDSTTNAGIQINGSAIKKVPFSAIVNDTSTGNSAVVIILNGNFS